MSRVSLRIWQPAPLIKTDSSEYPILIEMMPSSMNRSSDGYYKLPLEKVLIPLSFYQFWVVSKVKLTSHAFR